MTESEGTVPDEGDTSWKREKYARGHRKQAILRDLAEGMMTQTAIAEKYGVTRGRISQLANWPEHRRIIDEMKKNLDDQFAGMWVAQKKHRIADYQQQIEDIDETMRNALTVDPALVRARAALVRSVAEEMAQLPNRVTVQVQKRRVENLLDGVDTDKDLT